jgi:hypothetical protein
MNMTAIDAPSNTSAPGAALFLMGLAVAPLAPGFFLVLAMTGNILAALTFGVIGGAVVGYPFVFLVFAPTVFVLARHWRMTWWSLAGAGFLSVFGIAIAHCIVQGHLEGGFAMDFLFAACSGVGGLCFWLVTGDFGGPAHN